MQNNKTHKIEIVTSVNSEGPWQPLVPYQIPHAPYNPQQEIDERRVDYLVQVNSNFYFKVRVLCLAESECYCQVKMSVDGEPVQLSAFEYSTLHICDEIMELQPENGDKKVHYKFTPLQIAEQDEEKEEANSLLERGVGTIKLSFRRITHLFEVRPNTDSWEKAIPNIDEKTIKIDEKATKRCGLHATKETFGPLNANREFYSTKFEEKPFEVFFFHYRDQIGFLHEKKYRFQKCFIIAPNSTRRISTPG